MNKTAQSLQPRLIALGYPLPKIGADGDPGDETLAAMNAELGEVEKLRWVKLPAPSRSLRPMRFSLPSSCRPTGCRR